MRLVTEPYCKQKERWPEEGCHILAQYTSKYIIVYQAYKDSTGQYAAKHKYFGADFSYSRMSWIKPNFLWMMYRSGWGSKEGQFTVLAIYLGYQAFEKILDSAVLSSFRKDIYNTEEEWKNEFSKTEVVIQWDPDHDPYGNKVRRRAIQIGMRGKILEYYSRKWILEIEDITEFVKENYFILEKKGIERLITPKEEIYKVNNEEIAKKIGL